MNDSNFFPYLHTISRAFEILLQYKRRSRKTNSLIDYYLYSMLTLRQRASVRLEIAALSAAYRAPHKFRPIKRYCSSILALLFFTVYKYYSRSGSYYYFRSSKHISDTCLETSSSVASCAFTFAPHFSSRSRYIEPKQVSLLRKKITFSRNRFDDNLVEIKDESIPSPTREILYNRIRSEAR